MTDDEFDILRHARVPEPCETARVRALEAALRAYDRKSATETQGVRRKQRLMTRAIKLWSGIMNAKLAAAPAIAGLVALPIAGYAAFYLIKEQPFAIPRNAQETQATPLTERPVAQPNAESDRREGEAAAAYASRRDQMRREKVAEAAMQQAAGQSTRMHLQRAAPTADFAAGNSLPTASPTVALPVPPSDAFIPGKSRDRFANVDDNPVKSAREHPVSTFSIDVDTASYSFVRRALQAGALPDPDSVRVEEMINYFPYDWPGPDSASVPFNSMVTVMPTPWNEHTRLMHVAIKGYDVQAAERPRANLVFLIDVSGSMMESDRLPLLKSAFRMLVDRLTPDDTVSIITYAGAAGTVLEPTRGSEKARIFDAIDRLEAGGSTAGEAGIREAYRLAQNSFIQGGVNRVMLATDGDFNVGTTDDDELMRLVEEKRKTGVFLSVFGFGRGNFNDRLMQVLAQNGNGTAAYIDTLAEAEKVLVEGAGSTLFPIAKDVKIQVEFNPEKIAEYRLIGYETRALRREDFNNDRVDAGDIGSGHSVTAIYEITPTGSPAVAIDDLRYGKPQPAAGNPNADEYAFVKIRYKLPDEDASKLITTPVTRDNEVGELSAASDDRRFSIAVAAFGQKLRNAHAVANMRYDRIMEIAAAARGADPFGYRSEFLSLVRLASAFEKAKR